MSPRIGVFQSKRLEDDNRSRYHTRSRQVEKDREKDQEGKTLPMTRQSAASTPTVEKEKRVEKNTESSRAPPPQAREQPFPYVEVQPIKSAIRPMTVTAPVNVSVNDLPKEEHVYRSRAPVETGLDIESLVDKVLDLEINLPLRSLAGVSNVIQKEIRRQVTKTRQVADEKKKVHWAAEESQNMMEVSSLPMSEYMIMEEVSDEVPEGHLVANDPVLQYLLENRDAEPRQMVAAKSSEPLRAVFMRINGVGQEECLLDNGSMIVSMAKETAVGLGLTWDPGVRINMESASNHMEKSLGIAKNVRFSIGGLDLFLQVHIMDRPPYTVLLGRPFEVFTSSESKTWMDGSTEITITDPNTKATATVPTCARGMGPEQIQKQRCQSF